MAIAMLQIVPGRTQEDYEQVGERVFGARSLEFAPEQAPEGLILHSAGPTEDGWWVYDIWASQADMQRFFDERLAPAMRDLGMPAAGKPQMFTVHNVVQPPASD